MKKTILAALLLFGAAGPVIAESLSDRFKDDFGDTPPGLSDPPDANAAPTVAPKPRHRASSSYCSHGRATARIAAGTNA